MREHGGRERALAALRSAAEGAEGADAAWSPVSMRTFDRLDGTLAKEAHVVWTDLHDLELVLIHSPALERLLKSSWARPTSARPFEQERGAVRDALLAHGVKLGRLRWLSKRQQLGLVFRKDKSGERHTYLPYQDFCDLRQFTVDDRQDGADGAELFQSARPAGEDKDNLLVQMERAAGGRCRAALRRS